MCDNIYHTEIIEEKIDSQGAQVISTRSHIAALESVHHVSFLKCPNDMNHLTVECFSLELVKRLLSE